ncbi:hypothetical protein HU200_058150 [Digitaria exilis]|uniref:Uncharacterized protein n=1 Tax=Digitaria exilis TaxID=1010633 RepID=A0A835E4B0_9POAL|nr:hypothetical protein HU200_058150 [Digitaria exilis]
MHSAWNDCRFFPQSVTAKRGVRLPTQTGKTTPRCARREGPQGGKFLSSFSFVPTTLHARRCRRPSFLQQPQSFFPVADDSFLVWKRARALHGTLEKGREKTL